MIPLKGNKTICPKNKPKNSKKKHKQKSHPKTFPSYCYRRELSGTENASFLEMSKRYL